MDLLSDDDEEETLLYYMVYCSRAVGALDRSEIGQIVSAAQEHNSRESITGWLVYSNGIFFQWLEGSRESVTRLMASIIADSRHDTIVVLSEAEEVRGRLFSGWGMELVAADEIRAVLSDAIQSSDDSRSIGALQLLLTELDTKAVGAPGNNT